LKSQSHHLLTLVALLFVVAASWAQAQTVRPEAQEGDLLKVPVWVESDGGFWDDGRRQDFKVFIEEEEVPIRGFQSPASSTIILVVFDTVADLARVDRARSALSDAIRQLGDQYWVGLLRAQDGLDVIQEPTADRSELARRIAQVQVGGAAGLLDTLEPAANMATAILRKAGVRLSLLYITDGSIAHYRADYLNPTINSSDRGDLSRRFGDRVVRERISRLAESLAHFRIPIYVLHLAHRSDPLNLVYQSGLERISADSGGAAISCRAIDEIRPSLDSLLSRIRSGYVIGIDQPRTRRNSVRVRVALRQAEGGKPARVSHSDVVTLTTR
jgi:hypothetical protein